MSFLLKPTQHLTATKPIKNHVFSLGVLVLMLVLSQFAFSAPEASNTRQEADIRLLIDISGSMKKNDPANLRIPAVSLLTELIPDGDKAGVWTFGQWVNNLVRSKVVDDAWRQDAKEQAKKINSVALYTNIGAVLEKASDDFSKPGADFTNTHFILLTDGMVDIDRDTAKNDVERDRVLTSVLNTFKERGAKIHAVSLSQNADLSLMDKLAIQTGGQSAVAETSEELTKVFVQALNQAVPSEEVPIEGNEFVIDSSIEEFTALIFRGDDGLPTEIISPDNTVYRYGNNDDDVKWFQDRGYDLITITRPHEGTWTIKSDIQPESRVTVVSNLQLNVSKLPANFFAGEQLKVDVSFIGEDETIVNPDFLSLLDVELQLKTEEGKSASKAMSDSTNPPLDGIFSESITKLTKVGKYEVTVLVDGKTFKRSKRQVVNLRAPFDFEFSVKSADSEPHYELVVTPLNDSIAIEETSIFVKTTFPDNTSLISALEMEDDKNRWVLDIPPSKGDGIYKVAVKVKSKTITGQDFQFKPKAFEAEFPIPIGSANKIVSVNEESEELVEEVVPEKPEPKPELVEEPEPPVEVVTAPEAVEAQAEEESGAFWWIIGGAITAGLLLLSGLVYFLLAKKRKSKEEEPGEVLSDADIAALDSDEEELAEEIPVVDEVVEEEPVIEEPVIEEPVIEEPVIEEPLAEEPDDEEVKDLSEDLDFMESTGEDSETDAEDVVQDLEEALNEEDDGLVVDLSADDLSDVAVDLEDSPDLEVEEAEESDLSDIAQAIEESAEEPTEALDEEIEKALDFNDDDDDDDEEFNLEDFDIGDTDDLPEDKP